MEERRKNKRTRLPSKLVMKQLSGEGDRQISIRIADVSKSGIGFQCKEQLKIGEVYEAFLTIWTKEVIHAFLQIVRVEVRGRTYSYGAIFMGMSDADLARIEVYQTIEDTRKH